MQHEAHQKAIGERPEQRRRQCRADDIGQPPRRCPARGSRKQPDQQGEQPPEAEQHEEDGERDEADIERMRRLDRRQVHQRADGILPFRRAPEEDQHHDAADPAGHRLQPKTHAVLRLRKFEPEPQRRQSNAKPVAAGHGDARQHALRDIGARQKARRQRGGEEQRAEDEASGRKGKDEAPEPIPHAHPSACLSAMASLACLTGRGKPSRQKRQAMVCPAALR